MKQLNEAKKATLVYIERKEKESKDKALDYKGQKRLEEMKNAYNSLNVRIDRAESKLEALEAKSKSDDLKQMKKFVEEKRAEVPGKTGLEKIIAMQSKTAAQNLCAIAGQKSITKSDPHGIRSSVAALLLEQNIKDKSITMPIPATMSSYSKLVNKIATSEEFKNMFPDKNLTPDYCKNLLTDPKVLKGINRKFLENVRKVGAKEKQANIQVNLNRQNPEAQGQGLGAPGK
ncbi:MAG: hypothetical protein IKN34_00060 [Treponema sp.]|nr:hypothetical protein [Treponema sp.]